SWRRAGGGSRTCQHEKDHPGGSTRGLAGLRPRIPWAPREERRAQRRTRERAGQLREAASARDLGQVRGFRGGFPGGPRHADRELKPNARRWDREHRYPSDAVKKAFELGLGGVAVPEEWGGAGMDNVAYALAIEEISRGCASVGVTLSVNNSLYCDPVSKYGTEAQKERWLKPFATGEKLGCFGLTEPQAGSDAAEQRTTAVRRGDRYVINGTKNWITNGP